MPARKGKADAMKLKLPANQLSVLKLIAAAGLQDGISPTALFGYIQSDELPVTRDGVAPITRALRDMKLIEMRGEPPRHYVTEAGLKLCSGGL